jgi:hypothetical protein
MSVSMCDTALDTVQLAGGTVIGSGKPRNTLKSRAVREVL